MLPSPWTAKTPKESSISGLHLTMPTEKKQAALAVMPSIMPPMGPIKPEAGVLPPGRGCAPVPVRRGRIVTCPRRAPPPGRPRPRWHRDPRRRRSPLPPVDTATLRPGPSGRWERTPAGAKYDCRSDDSERHLENDEHYLRHDTSQVFVVNAVEEGLVGCADEPADGFAKGHAVADHELQQAGYGGNGEALGYPPTVPNWPAPARCKTLPVLGRS